MSPERRMRLAFGLVVVGAGLQLTIGNDWWAVGTSTGFLLISWIHQREAQVARAEAHLFWLAAKHDREDAAKFYEASRRIADDNLAQLQEWTSEDRYRP